MKRTRTLLLIFLALAVHWSRGQQPTLSTQARFSVVTCGPGTDLYATFGHSAFRLRDPAQGIDWVYNYGTFDFNTPNFYLKFARGKLPYALSKSSFEDFLYVYQWERRWVREQLLNLDPAQMEALLSFLETNNLPENRYYTYDFLFENCATKIPEVLQQVLGPSLVFHPEYLEGDPRSFRELIQENLEPNTWSSMGIDLALGAVIDRDAQPEEYMFLPAYVRQQMEHTSLGNSALVERERVILDLPNPKVSQYFTATPVFWLLLLLGFTLAITGIDYQNGTRSRVLDFVLFFTTGAAGLLLLFLWFLTDHTSTAWNANLLWAFPANLYAAWLLVRANPRIASIYRLLWVALALLGLCLPIWAAGLQSFSPVIPIAWAALALRYAYLIHYFKPAK